MRTLHNSLLPVNALDYNPYNYDDTFPGEVIDLGMGGNDFRDVEFIVYIDSVEDGTYTLELQEYDADLDDYVACADEYILGEIPTLDDSSEGCLKFGYKAHGVQLIRLSMTSADTDDGGRFCVVALLGNGSHSPPLTG